MRKEQWYVKDCRHEYSFMFNGKYYPLNSYVKLTEYGKRYLDTKTDEIQLVHHYYINNDEVECWTFITKYIDWPIRPFRVTTDEPLEKLIEEVIPPAPVDINLQQKYSSVAFKDWEVSDVLFGWVCVLIFFIVVEVLKDWFIKFILRIVVGWYFGLWRQRRMIEEAKWKDNNNK